MSDEKEKKSELSYKKCVREWNTTKEHGNPEAGRRVHLRLSAEYHGSWEPEEGQEKKGQWFLDKPLVNVQEWKYLNETVESEEEKED